MATITEENFSWTTGVKVPIVISEDTVFRSCNFSQAFPHTDGIFALVPSPGMLTNPVLRFDDCTLVNVTIPDGAIVNGGNPAHYDDLTIGALHECQKCASSQQELAERAAAGTLPRDAQGRVQHHALKDAFRARRTGPKASADLTALKAQNAAIKRN